MFLLNENVVTGDGLITDCDFSKVKEKFNAGKQSIQIVYISSRQMLSMNAHTNVKEPQ